MIVSAGKAGCFKILGCVRCVRVTDRKHRLVMFHRKRAGRVREDAGL